MSAAFREVEARGLYWRVFGRETDATPLVVVHGLFGAGDNWRGHAQELGRERLVLVPDMPNHGRSRHTEDMGFQTVARELWASLGEVGESLGIHSAEYAVLGHSLGGKAAMAMAFAQPNLTNRVISADIAPREYPASHEEVFAAMEAVAEAKVRRRSEADQIMAEHITTKAIRLFLLKSLVRDGDSGDYHWQLNLAGLRRSYAEIRGWPFETEQYVGPTLFIAGEQSPYIGRSDFNAIGRHFPNYRLETILGVGHWLHAEARETFLALVSAFLS